MRIRNALKNLPGMLGDLRREMKGVMTRLITSGTRITTKWTSTARMNLDGNRARPDGTAERLVPDGRVRR
jgi:hypothetical protein